MRKRAIWLLVALLAPSAAGCDVQTATAPGGDLTLYATFDDVQDLTRGHYVQISDVVVGSVGDLDLDGYRARARLDIDADREIPVGTRAVVRRTSLLGEHFVELVLPDTFVPGDSPLLSDGDEIADTASQLELEELAARASAVLGAIDAGALATTIDAGDRAIGDRGEQVNELIAQTGDIVATLRDQQDTLIGTVDALGTIGAQFAPHAEDLVALIDSLDQATRTVAANRDRAVTAARSLVDLARVTNDQVLIPHTERIVGLLAEADPVLGALAARSSAISDLFDDIVFFNEVFPTVQANGQVLLQAWLDPSVLLGNPGTSDVTDPARLLTQLLNGVL